MNISCEKHRVGSKARVWTQDLLSGYAEAVSRQAKQKQVRHIGCNQGLMVTTGNVRDPWVTVGALIKVVFEV